MEPEKFLADLGWSLSGPRPAATVSRSVNIAPRRYCSFCWCILPEGAEECLDCGQSVAEMETARVARAEQDRGWIPPRMWAAGQGLPQASAPQRGRLFQPASVAPAASPAAAPPLAPAPLVSPPSALVISWRHVILAVGVGGFFGGATVAGLAMLIQTFGRPAGASPGALNAPGVPAASLAPARLTWRNPVSELRLKLVSVNGTVAADNSQPEAAGTLEPGEYRLRVTDNTGRWASPEERVVVAPGEVFVAGPSPRVVAGYYLWAGKKLYEAQKLDRAERVWTKAVQAYPEGTDARLQLAALLAVRYRYAEARAQLQEVLRRDPASAEALRLMKTLDELEPRR